MPRSLSSFVLLANALLLAQPRPVPLIYQPLSHGSYVLLNIADFNSDGGLDFAFGGYYSSTVLIQTPAK